MPVDLMGRITVPSPVASGLTWPLVSDFGYGVDRTFTTASHRFGELATLATQTFLVGTGPRRFHFRRATLDRSKARAQLLSFYESVQGSYKSFIYNAPSADGATTTAYPVVFENTPISVDELVNASQSGLTFVECPDSASAPSYLSYSTSTRFPSDSLKAALLNQVQQLIPLVHIKVQDLSVPGIYLSDQRVSVDGQVYLPRILGIGEPGSDVLMSQNISGAADNVQFQFGNADRAMTKLANDCQLKYASIDLCFYHVASHIILQLWKGEILSYQTDGGNIFPVQCTDGAYYINRLYPLNVVSRECWKTFNDGVNCKYSTLGSGGDPLNCDYYFDSPSGCQSHGMAPSFGGHPASPQGVNIKDNSTGVAGFGRNNVTATSIISDSAWGSALPEIWCNDDGDVNKAFYANALMIDTRDEGDFQDNLGIVGAGPIGQYAGMSVATTADGYKHIVAPLVDGFPPHGFSVDSALNIKTNTTLGLREVAGTDPAVLPADSFSLGQGTPQVWGPQAAAGTAFVELRYRKPSGITPTSADQHQMVVPISRGLSGYVWSADGATRTLVAGLTNPFWVAINTWLRAKGLFNADAATQYAAFYNPVVGDGSGPAEIADLTVDALLGGGTETQFRFQGVLAQQKPVRDWLTEILNCALGYFSFEFGKLRLGIRENASAVETFTAGNMLFQSLRLSPIEPQFEKLVIDFADRDYQYQHNQASYYDKGYSLANGRANAPLAATMHSVGISTVSQGSRVAATRTREEIGGVSAAEWATARLATWQTTVLSMNTGLGQVVSLTGPDVPNGTANFRIQSWRLLRDWRIEITGKTVTASMYDLDIGPKPVDVTPSKLPILLYPLPAGQEWAPYQYQCDPMDAIFPGEWTFDVGQSYLVRTDGTAAATATVTGKMPVNTFIPNCGAPIITDGNLTESGTGGSIVGAVSGSTLRIAICAKNAAGQLSPPSPIILTQIAASSTSSQFTISGIVWPEFAGLTEYVVFVGSTDYLISAQASGALTPSGSGTSYTPTSITVNGPLARSTWGIPDSSLTHVRVKEKPLVHAGVAGAAIDSIAGSVVTCSELVDIAGLDNWAGRNLILLGRNNGTAPCSAYNIIAFDPATGACTLDRVPADLMEGDAIAISFKGYDNSGNLYLVTDAGIKNAQNPVPHTGLKDLDGNLVDETGLILYVWNGLNRGNSANIIASTEDSWTTDIPIYLDDESVWFIVGNYWAPYAESAKNTANSDYLTPQSVSIDMTNLKGYTSLIAGYVVDDQNVESVEYNAPMRPLYIFGSPGLTGGGAGSDVAPIFPV